MKRKFKVGQKVKIVDHDTNVSNFVGRTGIVTQYLWTSKGELGGYPKGTQCYNVKLDTRTEDNEAAVCLHTEIRLLTKLDKALK